MKAFISLIIIGLLAAGGYYVWRGDVGGIGVSSNIEVIGDEIIVDTADIQAVLSDNGEFYGDYMLFGGTYVSHKNAVVPILIAGLNIINAREIYRDYPDFHKCASPGASLAKPLVEDLNIVPEDSRITSKLKKSISEFKRNINMKDGGERVCISLEGRSAQLQSVTITQANTDVTDKFKMQNLHIINAIEIIDCNDLLASE